MPGGSGGSDGGGGEGIGGGGEGIGGVTRDDLSPMPNLTESSSFLSGVSGLSRDSPIGTLSRDLVTDFQVNCFLVFL